MRPTIIFKGKQWPRVKGTLPPPRRIKVVFQEKGWMDGDGMNDWVRDWVKHRPGSVNMETAMLVYDSFKAHLTDDVRAALGANKTDLVVIPGGLTSICQPLDVGINRPFKVALRRHWHSWMADGGNGTTATGNLKRASHATACQWVLDAWEEIEQETIRKAFLKCSISNAMDGSQDNLVYESDEELDGEQSDIEIEYNSGEESDEVSEVDVEIDEDSS